VHFRRLDDDVFAPEKLFMLKLFHCNICKIFTKENDITSLPRDIHGAPAGSLVVKLAEIIGNYKTLR